jgi:hypothetical protein
MADKNVSPKPKRQTTGDLPVFLNRIIPFWGTPSWLEGTLWRKIVNHQMLAKVCRDLLIMQVLQMKWNIKARDLNQAEELKGLIKHYIDILLDGGGDGYDVMVDLLLQDALDIPFGGALEQIRSSTGDLEGLVNIDGATLRPTPDWVFPVVQTLQGASFPPVFLRRNEVARLYLSPRTPIRHKGWGMAPPERIYLALELIGRGDRYYANLLLDTPPAGLLDLLDVEEDAAIKWATSFRELMVGTEAFKIPVLYEHEKAAVYVPFGTPPAEMLFETTILQYAGITCAGYGMMLSDLGLARSQMSLAGSIRDERRSRRLGFGVLLMKLETMWNRVLPSELTFVHVYDDEESLIARGRSRLTNARALNELVKTGIISPDQAREQLEADGLLTVDLTKPPDQEIDGGERIRGPQEAHLIGKPTSPSEGGHGEIKTTEGKNN